MAWCMVRFSIADLDAKRHVPLQGAFENVFRAASSPKNAAMFANKYMEAGRTYYFSPEAVAICSAVLREFAPTKCQAPGPHTISWVAGHAGAIRMLGL
jgi:hypothetical protein